MMFMKYPVGIDHFGELIDSGAAWVDKSLFIKEIIDNGSKIILIPRPRRFGKTLNLSMLQHFFAKKVDEQPTADLFKGLKIDQVEGDYLEKYQGKYPVILVTFKGIKTSTYKEATEKLNALVQELYMEHRELLTSKSIEPEEKAIIETYLSGKMSQSDLELSLKRLTQYLKKHYKKNAILLIDEYDAPLPNREVLDFFKSTLCRWLLGGRSAIGGDHFLQNLLDGDFERAELQFNELLLRVISHHDVTERTQEAFYQGLMIGCLLLLDPERYIYDSNRESGFGRYDLAIYPTDPNKDAGAIFELKAFQKKSKSESEPQDEALEDLAQKALEQIDWLKYTEELKKRNVSTVRKIGFAFCGKQMKMAYPPVIPADDEV